MHTLDQDVSQNMAGYINPSFLADSSHHAPKLMQQDGWLFNAAASRSGFCMCCGEGMLPPVCEIWGGEEVRSRKEDVSNINPTRRKLSMN